MLPSTAFWRSSGKIQKALSVFCLTSHLACGYNWSSPSSKAFARCSGWAQEISGTGYCCQGNHNFQAGSMRSGGGGGALGVVGGGGLPRLRRSARLLRAAAAAAAAGEEEGGAAGGVAAGGNGRRGGVGGAGGAAEETAAGAEPRRRGGKRKNEEEGQKAAPSATKRISRQKTAKGESSGGRQETGKITTTSAKKKSGKGAKAPSNGPSRDKEERLVAGGRATHVVGTDEAGRGPLAGPVVAAAAWLPPGDMIPGITDSKMVSKEEQREELYKILINKPGVVWATHITDAKRIDEINILNASLESMRFAAEEVVARLQQEQAGGGRGGRGGGGGGGCTVAPYILVDGNRLPKEMRHDGEAVVKGDASQYCIAAASIIAKVTRDRIMAKYHERWPEYGFLQHKGYPTKAHMAAISKNGPCEIHRMTFRPLKTEDAETNKK